MMKWIMATGLTAMMAIPSFAATTTWNLDPPHCNAQFIVRHVGISNIQGEFTKISGVVYLDDQDVTKSTVSATIDTTSVFTRSEARDEDLRSAHFFDVAKYPTMTFQSTKIVKTGDGTAKMTGNLTMHGVTREVTFDLTGPSAPATYQGTRRGAEATTKINRKDFGITYSMIIGDEVSIILNVEMLLEGSVPPTAAVAPKQ